MAVWAGDAIAAARRLIGTPYAQLDCINLIKKIIREAPGGVKGYTTAGTNALWNSFEMSEKYRDLTWRQEGLAGARAGMLAFKGRAGDMHHVGLATGEGTVIHSSSAGGGRGVVETALSAQEGWTHLAVHRRIMAEEKTIMGERGIVKTQGGRLNVRDMADGRVIGQLDNGSEVEIIASDGDWLKIVFGEEGSGYVFAAYISWEAQKKKHLRIVDEAGDIYDFEGAITIRIAQNGD